MTLDEESDRATMLLSGKVVRRIARFRGEEILVEFEDGSRLYAASTTSLELSVTVAE